MKTLNLFLAAFVLFATSFTFLPRMAQRAYAGTVLEPSSPPGTYQPMNCHCFCLNWGGKKHCLCLCSVDQGDASRAPSGGADL